jgi:N-acetyl-anhydromuramyl-L-alanine amidase AmpD
MATRLDGEILSRSSPRMVQAPEWTDLPARYRNPRKLAITGIVLHDTAGSGTHNDTLYLVNPQDGRRVSVDFTVEKDGSVWRLNPDLIGHCCNHAGRATKWRQYKNAEVNQVTVGIEIVQKNRISQISPYPLVQVERVAYLCAWLTSTLKLSTSDVTTHRNIITDGSRSDPRQFPFDGSRGFWAKYWEALGRGKNFVRALRSFRDP